MLTFADYTESTDHPGYFVRELRAAGDQSLAMLEVRRGSDGYNLGAFPESTLKDDIAAFIDTQILEGPTSLKAQLDAFNAAPAPNGTDATDTSVAAAAIPDRDNEAASVEDGQPPMPTFDDVPAADPTADPTPAPVAAEQLLRRDRNR